MPKVKDFRCQEIPKIMQSIAAVYIKVWKSDAIFRNLIRIYGIKGITYEFTMGAVLKQLNYPVTTLPILFRHVDHIVNDRLMDPLSKL